MTDDAERNLRDAANKGDAEDMFALSVLLEKTGRRFRARTWLLRAGQAGHPAANNKPAVAPRRRAPLLAMLQLVPQEVRILLADHACDGYERRVVGRVRVRIEQHAKGDRAADLVMFGADEQLKADAAVPLAQVGDGVVSGLALRCRFPVEAADVVQRALLH